jgi:peptidoglycan/LPS O-acetylase OafA/YrhL
VIVFAVGASYSRPPAWLGILAGSAFLVYFAYRVRKDWHNLTGGELAIASLLMLMGAVFLFDGLTDLFRH